MHCIYGRLSLDFVCLFKLCEHAKNSHFDFRVCVCGCVYTKHIPESVFAFDEHLGQTEENGLGCFEKLICSLPSRFFNWICNCSFAYVISHIHIVRCSHKMKFLAMLNEVKLQYYYL